MLFLFIFIDVDVVVKNMCSVLPIKCHKGFRLHLGRAKKYLLLLLKIIRFKYNVCVCMFVCVCVCVRARSLILALLSVMQIHSFLCLLIVISDMFGSTTFFHIIS